MTFNEQVFLWVLGVVRASGAVAVIEQVLKPDPRAGGRPRRFGLDVWLAAFVTALLTGASAYEKRAHRVLVDDLALSLQVKLGIRVCAVEDAARSRPISERQIRETLDRLDERLNPDVEGISDEERDYRERTLRTSITLMVRASVPERFRALGGWAVDNTAVDAWSRPWTKNKDTTGAIANDKIARFGYRTGTYQNGERKRVFGYHMTAFTVIKPDVPAFVEVIETRAANEDGADAAVALARLLAVDLEARGRQFGILISDQEYSKSRPERFHEPLRALGVELVSWTSTRTTAARCGTAARRSSAGTRAAPACRLSGRTWTRRSR